MRSAARALSTFVGAVSLAVMYGWLADVAWLKSLRPGWVTMKASTAISLFLASGTCWFSYGMSDRQKTLTVAFALGHAGLMSVLLLEALTGADFGVRHLLAYERVDALHTEAPGEPSILTMVSFVSLGLSGLLMALEKDGSAKSVGSFSLVAGGVAILGYLVKRDWMYGRQPGYSSAMALHTAICLFLLGLTVLLKPASEELRRADHHLN